MIKPTRKNVSNQAEDEPATTWSPVGRAPNWADSVGFSPLELGLERIC